MPNRVYTTGYSSGVDTKGLWRAVVKSVDNDKHISVIIPKLSAETVYREVRFSGISPEVGDEVYVSLMDGSQRSFVAITSPESASVFGSITSPLEPVKTYDQTSGEIDLFLSEAAVHWFTKIGTAARSVDISASSTETLGSTLGLYQAVTVAVFLQNGPTAYPIGDIKIDGTTSNVTVMWDGIDAPTGNPNNLDFYKLTIIKTVATTPATYTVIGSYSGGGGSSITISTDLPSGGSDGDIWMVYS